jgi:hypothetical protein
VPFDLEIKILAEIKDNFDSDLFSLHTILNGFTRIRETVAFNFFSLKIKLLAENENNFVCDL